MIFKDITKLKRAEAEEELDLYREAGIQNVVASDDLKNVGVCIEEIQRLQKEVGYPVKLTPEFVAENDVLAKFLMENGAVEGDIVMAEDADLEEVAKIEAQLKADADKKRQDEEDAAAAENKKGEQNSGNSATTGATASAGANKVQPDLVYQGKTVVNVANALVHGQSVKDVYVASGECFRMSQVEFDKEVKLRE